MLEPNATYYIASYEDSTQGDYLVSGTVTTGAGALWGSPTVGGSSVTMDPSVGTWSTTTFAPIVNAKVQ